MDPERLRMHGPRLERPVGRHFPVAVITQTHPHCSAAAARPPRQYEFPTGYNSYFGAERFAVGEMLFRHSAQLAVRLSQLRMRVIL